MTERILDTITPDTLRAKSPFLARCEVCEWRSNRSEMRAFVEGQANYHVRESGHPVQIVEVTE